MVAELPLYGYIEAKADLKKHPIALTFWPFGLIMYIVYKIDGGKVMSDRIVLLNAILAVLINAVLPMVIGALATSQAAMLTYNKKYQQQFVVLHVGAVVLTFVGLVVQGLVLPTFPNQPLLGAMLTPVGSALALWFIKSNWVNIDRFNIQYKMSRGGNPH